MPRIVNSWNEWDPLKRIILGRPEGTCVPAPDAGYWPIDDEGEPKLTCGPLDDEKVAAANEQMDHFAAILDSRGVIVDRVEIHPTMHLHQPISNPDWVALYQYGSNNPRDTAIVLGNEIMEAPVAKRSRWYEYLSLRPVFERYLKEDPDFLWTSAPRPRLTDQTYVGDYFQQFHKVWSEEERLQRLHAWEFQLTEKEPLFDAADGLRCGRDLFWQASTTTNRTGFDWVKRYFSARGIRVHMTQFDGDLRPWHIDANLAIVRPGLAIYNAQMPPRTPEFLELIKKNDWELVAGAVPEGVVSPDAVARGGFFENMSWVAINCLMLDPNTACCPAHETAHMELLTKLDVDVIPVPYDRVLEFGGSLHCTTLDVYREGSCEDYFPNQIPGF
jgi:glycine amidinotransferase